MRKTLIIAAALAFAIIAPSYAQTIDKNGRCHDAHGKFAKMDVCKGHAPEHTYKLDDKGKCHDERGKFAKQDLCHR